MKNVYPILSGASIQQIPAARKLTTTRISADDLFLISQPMLSSVDPDRTYEWNGQTYVNEYASRNISYESLSANVFDDLSAGFGFKSMAWELSDGYSLINHRHDGYSTLSVVPTRYSDDIMQVGLSSIGMFSVNTRKYAFSMPRIRMFEAPRPYIGQLRFMAISNPSVIPNTDEYYSSGSFDGWVYPDGREVSQTIFADAYRFFGNSYGTAAAGKFKLPNVTEFIRPATTTNATTSLVNRVPEQKSLPEHKHTITDMQLSGSIQTDISVASYSDNTWKGPDSAAQHGGKTPDSYDYNFTAVFKCSALTCDNNPVVAAGDNAESYPTHVMVPVLMYIGGIA